LEDAAPDVEEALPSKARRYHAAVRFLREAVGRHVDTFIAASRNTARAREHAGF
jgi:hypothetical protein